MSDGTVARAFELARAGTCRSVEDIKRQLRTEGYSSIPEHLSGPAIKKQLSSLLKARS
jgi:hypothetical protein